MINISKEASYLSYLINDIFVYLNKRTDDDRLLIEIVKSSKELKEMKLKAEKIKKYINL